MKILLGVEILAIVGLSFYIFNNLKKRNNKNNKLLQDSILEENDYKNY
jgi:hypothetical protein